MYRLGLRLTLRSGREALTRLLVTMAAVAAGVTILLAVLADFHAFQYTNEQPAWQSTQSVPHGPNSSTGPAVYQAAGSGPNAGVELWNYGETVFQGQTIQQLDVAALGPHAPLPPGIGKLPGAGQYYASPALASLIASTPRDELGDRFPGTQVGTIGDRALTGPDDLVIFTGYQPAQLAALSPTIRVDTVAAGAQTSVWTNYFRYAFAVGALAFLFPILILIGMATRLAATRREERYAALRLVGATNRQVNVISSVDAIVSSLMGALVGIALFVPLRPLLANASLFGSRYFSYAVTPTAAGYAAMLICVPIAAAVASLISLRRVRITPLGVSRRQTPPAPTFLRVLPLLLGIALFVYGVIGTTSEQIGATIYPGLLVILIGLVIGGPWLTVRAARLFALRTGTAHALLAARRLEDNPKAAFRSVSGLVLAVFLGTMLAGLMPAINDTTQTPSATAMSNVLLDTFNYSPVCGNEVNCSGTGNPPSAAGTNRQTEMIGLLGLPPATGAALVRRLEAFHGTVVVPLYSMPQDANPQAPPPLSQHNSDMGAGATVGPEGAPYNAIATCADLAKLPTLGSCAPGAAAVEVTAENLSTDNPSDSAKAITGPQAPTASSDVSGLYLQGVLVRVDDPTTLEVVRTFLTTHTPLSQSGSAPRTFGEEVRAREAVATIVQRVMNIAVALTLLVAGCSLAVAVGGGLVERKRPFSLLRLTGTPSSVLYKVVLLEAALPLAAATVIAMATGYGLAVITAVKVAPSGTPVPTPSADYYLTMGVGLVGSLLLIVGTLPFLGRITKSENARFE